MEQIELKQECDLERLKRGEKRSGQRKDAENPRELRIHHGNRSLKQYVQEVMTCEAEIDNLGLGYPYSLF